MSEHDKKVEAFLAMRGDGGPAFKAPRAPKNKMVLRLEHAPNEDLMHDERKGYWQAPKVPRVIQTVVPSLKVARELFIAWRDDSGFGGGNMTARSGEVTRNGKVLGRFSYNGRYTDEGGTECSIAFIDKYSGGEVIPHYDDGTDAGL